MKISFSSLAASERYQVMTQVIIPRPIAWILSDNGIDNSEKYGKGGKDVVEQIGRYNLAPFSYFNAVSSDPALVMVSVGSKPNGNLKDTRRNIIERNACVIHIPSQDQVHEVTQSAASLPHGESEVTTLGLTLDYVGGWPLPKLADSDIAMACHLYDVKEIGAHKQGLLFLEIDEVFVRDNCVTHDSKGRQKVDAGNIAPLARLGSSEYASFGDIIRLGRPK